MSYQWIFAPLAFPFVLISLPLFGLLVSAGTFSMDTFVTVLVLLPLLGAVLIASSVVAMWANRAPIVLVAAQSVTFIVAVYAVASFFISYDYRGSYQESDVFRAAATLLIAMTLSLLAGYCVLKRLGRLWPDSWDR